jgi:hypothetical protein
MHVHICIQLGPGVNGVDATAMACLGNVIIKVILMLQGGLLGDPFGAQSLQLTHSSKWLTAA